MTTINVFARLTSPLFHKLNALIATPIVQPARP